VPPAIGLGLVLLVLLTGLGPSIPGLEVRKWLGLRPDLSSGCKYDPFNVRSPSSPPAPAGSWRQEPLPPFARSESKAVTVGGRIYILGGYSTSTVADVLAFDPRSRRYSRETKMPVGTDHPLVTAHAGWLYVLGGYVNNDPQRGFWRYSPETKKWQRLADQPVLRGAMAGAVIGDKLYVAGGAPRRFPPEDKQPPYHRLDIYDLRTNSWSRGPDMPTARHHTAYAAIGRYLYVAGGRDDDDAAVKALERYDTRTRRWESLPALPFPLGGLEGAAYAGRFVVAGGGDERNWEKGGGFVTPSAWSFDPGSRRWSRLPDMKTARHGLAAAVLDGRLYTFDGVPCPGFGKAKVAESLGLN
jgi:N-acetylneuraminic acid mutarotase